MLVGAKVVPLSLMLLLQRVLLHRGLLSMLGDPRDIRPEKVEWTLLALTVRLAVR